MTDDMNCEEFQALSAELALGVLDGRERAEALAHLERCPSCRQELLLLSDLADGLVELTPAAEPPAGFETRVLAALSRGPAGVSPAPRSPAAIGRRWSWPKPVVLIAAAAAAVVVAVSGWAVGHGGASHGPSVAGGGVVTADFRQGQNQLGQVIATTGAHPWIYMVVDAGENQKSVICQVWEGATKVTVGSFVLDNGYGYWTAAIPKTATGITGAELLDSNGHTIATAKFSAKN